MTCQTNLMFLTCEYSGVGFTAQPVRKGDLEIQLRKGMGNNFPTLQAGTHFYVVVEGCSSCCEYMRVTGKDGDKLIVQRGLGSTCDCINSNAKVSYDVSNRYFYEDWANYIPLKATGPLNFDCSTNTLSVDCAELFKSGCGGCDCGEGATGGSGEVTGLRGPQGEQGPPGPTPTNINVSSTGVLTFSFSDGTSIQATGKVPRGPKGDKGDTGDQGSRGDAGANGADGGGIANAKMDGDDLLLYKDDGTEIRVRGVRGPQGEQGPPGPPGPPGPAGGTSGGSSGGSSGGTGGSGSGIGDGGGTGTTGSTFEEELAALANIVNIITAEDFKERYIALLKKYKRPPFDTESSGTESSGTSGTDNSGGGTFDITTP